MIRRIVQHRRGGFGMGCGPDSMIIVRERRDDLCRAMRRRHAQGRDQPSHEADGKNDPAEHLVSAPLGHSGIARSRHLPDPPGGDTGLI